jgi:hypothetical protein
VLNKSSANIWRGALNGKVGRFLARLVRELDDESTGAKPAVAMATNDATKPAVAMATNAAAAPSYEQCRAVDDCNAARRGDLAFKKVCLIGGFVVVVVLIQILFSYF